MIEAEAGTLMLPRLLQKLVCQGAEIQTLHYRRDDGVHTARVELHFQAEPARARLLVRKWETVLGLHRVDLEAGDSSGTCVRPAGQIPGGR